MDTTARPTPATPATPALAGPADAGRLLWVDWLRIAAFALLVLYHVGMVYVPWAFHVKHSPVYPALEPWMRLSNPWRMSLLFMVSGLATALMVRRRPRIGSGLLAERSRRLLLPLLFGMAVVVPLQPWLEVRDRFGYGGGFGDFLSLYVRGYHGFCDGRGCLDLPTWNHLWFLPYLWLYTAAFLALRRGLPAGAGRWLQAALASAAQQPGWRLMLWPVIVLAALRIALFPLFRETHALFNDGWAHAHYALMFAAGVALAHQPALLARLQGLRWPALALALAAWAVGTVVNARLDDAAGPLPETLLAPLRLAYAAQQWGALVAAFGFARRWLNHDHRWRAPLTEAVFPLYIAHQTLIIGGAVALRPLALPPGVEAALLVAGTLAGSWAVWRVARHTGPLRPWLGLPSPRRTAAPPEAGRGGVFTAPGRAGVRRWP